MLTDVNAQDVEVPMKIKGDQSHYDNAVFYNSMITQLLAKNLIKFSAVTAVFSALWNRVSKKSIVWLAHDRWGDDVACDVVRIRKFGTPLWH